MAQTIDHDSIQSTDAGYRYSQAEEVTIAPGVLVSATENYGVISSYAYSRLVNYGHIISTEEDGIGAQFDANDCSVLNGAGASIDGVSIGCEFVGNRMALTNHGTIQGLLGGGLAGVVCDGTESPDNADIAIFNGVGGVISGKGFSAIVAGGYTSGRVFIDNRGTLDGGIAMFFTDTNDTVINRGTIKGIVYLSDGNDVFNGLGGRSGAVFGGDGNDTLAGGNAADWLYGGADADVLTGRGGADRFVFDASLNAATNTDRIADFTADVDKIVLGKHAPDLFAAVGPAGILGAARFHVGAAATDASDRIIYNPNTGFLYYDEDGRGGDPQVRFAQLTKHLALDHADFLIIPIVV